MTNQTPKPDRLTVFMSPTECIKNNPGFITELVHLLEDAKQNDICILCIIKILINTASSLLGELAGELSTEDFTKILKDISNEANKNFTYSYTKTVKTKSPEEMNRILNDLKEINRILNDLIKNLKNYRNFP